jgi:hypothetical protein
VRESTHGQAVSAPWPSARPGQNRDRNKGGTAVATVKFLFESLAREGRAR